MKLAVVINVAAGKPALSRATRTQSLLLEQMVRNWIRSALAVPHLCSSPVSGRSPRNRICWSSSAVRKPLAVPGKVAMTAMLPILFLPGNAVPPWASRLWGSLSLEGMIAALAGENVTPIRLAAGWGRRPSVLRQRGVRISAADRPIARWLC